MSTTRDSRATRDARLARAELPGLVRAARQAAARLSEPSRRHAELEEKRAEPNSELGKAYKYMLKRWDKLTLFLHRPGVPLDNNICEQTLKMAIRRRRNSLFYRSERGAEIGDMFMALIHNAELRGENAFDYLTAVLQNESAVAEAPAAWMPWNYRVAIVRTTEPSAPPQALVSA